MMMILMMMMCVANFWGIAKDIFASLKKSTGRCCASAADEDRLASNMTSNMN